MRLFFGIPVDDDTRRRAPNVQERLRDIAGKVNWVEPANLHLTLRYIGDVPDEDVTRVAEAAEGCWREAVPDTVALQGVGVFPNPRQPRVIWVGLSEGGELLDRLHEALNDRLEAKLHMERERRKFTPHLTIGRVKTPPTGDGLTRAIKELADVNVGAFLASSFVLYESTLTRHGPVYSVIRKYAAQDPA